MTALFTFLIFFLFTLVFALPFAKGAERYWIWTWMAAAWLAFFPILVILNISFPFAGGGDDERYFLLAPMHFDSLVDVFDLTRFVGEMEQPGYPWLLSILYQFTGHDLLSLKVLNLAFYVMLIPVWFRIGLLLESKAFGRAMAVVLLLMTPLWYYQWFLLKDMVITLLQSLFLLCLVGALRNQDRTSWVLMFAATLAVIPFRSQLVLINVAVLAGSVALAVLRRIRRRRTVALVVMATIVISGSLAFASNRGWMAAIGITSESRVLGGGRTIAKAMEIGEDSKINRKLFPLLYVLSETSGLNPQTWVGFEAGTLRGVFALPWIFLGVPFFALGLLRLANRAPQASRKKGLLNRIRSSRLVLTPWGTLAIFVLVYMVMSWTVGDTTRWRTPDFPVLAAIALGGWMDLSRRLRVELLTLWILFCSTLFGLFYLLRE